MGNYTPPMIANAFDSFEFRGTVSAAIVYDPDIRMDSNICKDDNDDRNNGRDISDVQVANLLASKSASMTF